MWLKILFVLISIPFVLISISFGTSFWCSSMPDTKAVIIMELHFFCMWFNFSGIADWWKRLICCICEGCVQPLSEAYCFARTKRTEIQLFLQLSKNNCFFFFYCKNLHSYSVFNEKTSWTSPYFRGLVTIENITYGIEPMDSSSGSKHILYPLDNVKKEPTTCGVTTEGHEREHEGENHHPSMTQLLRVSAPLFSPLFSP